MTIARTSTAQSLPLNIVGSSKYGIYDKLSSERTFNMTISDDFLVPYPGYKIAIGSANFNDAQEGRGLYESVKLGKIIAVFDDGVYLITLTYIHQSQSVSTFQVVQVGSLQTSTGPVYIVENNKPQILISDGTALYIYDPSMPNGTLPFTAVNPSTSNAALNFNTLETFTTGQTVTLINSGGALPSGLDSSTTYYVINPSFPTLTTTSIQLADSTANAAAGIPIQFTDVGSGTNSLVATGAFQTVSLDFTPGYITFHDTYFIAAASNDTSYLPPANNTWRLSEQNNGLLFPSIAQNVGLLETKPDNTQAVVRFPSKGNMIIVMGETVTEFWYDVGAQLFPYQRQNQSSIDYGCINPATVAFMDEVVVWLARNEKSGPVIMFTTGGMPQKVTTDGIDFQLSQLDNPEDAQGFLYRKNGHLFYHLNFYTDNLSFIVDFNDNKIYNACDENLNYFIMGQVVWFNNQYFSVTKNNGNLFIFDTVFTTYETVDTQGNITITDIPRIRICDNVRLPSQDYFVVTDIGFTIEAGMTDYQVQDLGPLYFITEDGKFLVTEDTPDILVTEDNAPLSTEDGFLLITETDVPDTGRRLISEQSNIIQTTPAVDLSVSTDGGASFGSDYRYVLNSIGKRKNKLNWWQVGAANDFVPKFRFSGLGRVVAANGVVNIKT